LRLDARHHKLVRFGRIGAGSIVAQSDPWHTVGVREGEVLGGKYRIEKVLGVAFLAFGIAVAGCNSILGIEDHPLAADAGTGGSSDSGSSSGDASPSGSGAGSETGTSSGSSSGGDSGCPPCTLGSTSAKLGACCLGGP
jgi:hypothetical protein